MRFLADENFPGSSIRVLIEAGHDIVAVGLTAPGAGDADIVAWAAREKRIILTFDKDFGEIASRAALPAGCGVVLFRIPLSPVDAGMRVAARILERADWAGHFSVIEPGRVRMRPLANA